MKTIGLTLVAEVDRQELMDRSSLRRAFSDLSDFGFWYPPISPWLCRGESASARCQEQVTPRDRRRRRRRRTEHGSKTHLSSPTLIDHRPPPAVINRHAALARSTLCCTDQRCCILGLSLRPPRLPLPPSFTLCTAPEIHRRPDPPSILFHTQPRICRVSVPFRRSESEISLPGCSTNRFHGSAPRIGFTIC